MLNAVLVVLAIPFALSFLFRDPMVQTLSAKMLTRLLSQGIGRTVLIQNLKVDFFDGLDLAGLRIDDHHGNPMIGIRHLRARPRFANWGLLILRFKQLELDGAIVSYGRYQGDEDYNLTMLINDLSGSPDGGSGKFKLKVEKLKLTNSGFRFFDRTKYYDHGMAMDYADILIDSITIDATHFTLINDSLNFRIDHLSAREHCGVTIDTMRTDFSLSSTGLHAKDLHIHIANSSLDMDLDFNYHSYSAYSHFIDSVEMKGVFRPTTLEMADLGYFAEIMFRMPNKIGITGEVHGPVSNLKARDLRIHFGENTRLATDASIRGLPDFFSSYMQADFRELTLTACDLRRFSLPTDEQHIDLSDEVNCDEVFSLRGHFKGYYNDFVTRMRIRADEGEIDARLSFNNTRPDSLFFTLGLKGDSVDVGQLLGQSPVLGKMNLDMTVHGYGQSVKDLKLSGKAMLAAADFMGYSYKRVKLNGRYANDSLKANIRIGDKHLMLGANLVLSLVQQPVLYINSRIIRADLYALGLAPLSDFGLAGNVSLNLTGFDPATMTGNFSLKKGQLHFGQSVYELDSLTLTKSLDTDGTHSLQLRSDLFDFDMEGKYDITTVPLQLTGLLNHYYNFGEKALAVQTAGENHLLFTAELKKSRIIEEQLVPGLYIAPGAKAYGKIDFAGNAMDGGLTAGNVEYEGLRFLENNFTVKSREGRIFAALNNQRVIIKDSTESDKAVLGIDNLEVRADVGNDSLSYGIYWDNRDSLLQNYGLIEGYFATKQKTAIFVVDKSDVMVNDTAWHIAGNNSIVTYSTDIAFRNFVITGGSSKLEIDGKYSTVHDDTLQLVFRNWNLSNLDLVTQPLGINLDGFANGYLDFSRVSGKPAVISNLNIRSLYFNNEYLGDARLMNTWDNTLNSVFVKMQIVKEGTQGKGEIMAVDGYYYPFREEESLDLDIVFNRFRLRPLQTFFYDYVSDLEGMADGRLKLTGSIQDPQLTGTAKLHRTSLVINYLNTRYSFSNSLEFKPDEIIFDKVIIYDTLGNHANIVGSLNHHFFRDFQFNLEVTTDQLLFFNTDRHMNSLYYGTAITSGDILVSGSPADINLDIKVASKKGTHVYLPLDYSVEISDKDYIMCVDRITDSLELEMDTLMAEERKKKLQDELKYDIKLKLKVTPDATVSISMPGDMGTIHSEGRGDLSIHTNTEGDFTIVGDYTVIKGMFHFTIGNLVNKRFELVEGGRIAWTGDPYQANINIRGLYKVKTNLSSLGIQIDSSANYKNKVNVDCYVILTNEMLNPDVRFEIKFPDLDPDLQRMVYASLDTTNQAIVNQQMISLLVLGTFSFNNASNVGLNSAYYSVLTNQLSSMLSRISDDFDIGVNYKPGDQVTQEEFEVALSTQLFNDRLTIDGNFGLTYDRSSQNASNIVGDVDIGYKLTPDGQWYLKVFNHSNVNSWYNYSNYDKVSPYTQGVGIAFRKEFTTFAELFRRTKPKKVKKKKKKKEKP